MLLGLSTGTPKRRLRVILDAREKVQTKSLDTCSSPVLKKWLDNQKTIASTIKRQSIDIKGQLYTPFFQKEN